MRDEFLARWTKYLGPSQLPLCMFFRERAQGETVPHASGHSCMVALLRPALEGHTVVLDAGSIGCMGGKRYAGFEQKQTPGLAELLSCGVPGGREGLRYKKSPDIVRKADETAVWVPAPAPYLVTKRIDTLQADETPEVVAFLAAPDTLAALVHLAAYATPDRDAVICPQGAGCATLLALPKLEAQRGTLRAVLGMFDLSARPFLDPNVLSLAVPWERFVQMSDDMDESFLSTDGWRRLRDRASAPRG